MRVLIAEDEAIIRLDLREILEEEGYEVVAETGRGDEAVALTRELRPDLAILDIMGVDGMGLLTETVNRRIPTVMLTAHAMNPQTLKASIMNGALSYLPKEELANLPEHINDVLDAVEKGQSTWQRMFNRLGRFFERAYGPSWQSDDPEFWRYYYVPMV